MDKEEINIANICRTCLSIHNYMLNIADIDKKYDLPSYKEMLMSCTKIEIFENDGLPLKICIDCARQMRATYMYIKESERVDAILRQKVNKIRMTKQNDFSIFIRPEDYLKSTVDYSQITVKNEDVVDNADIFKVNIKTKPVFCSRCEKFFLTSEDLNTHNNTFHVTEKYICCRLCNQNFTCTENLQSHIIHEHLHELNYVCGYCDNIFLNKNDLDKHIIEHEVYIVNRNFCTEDVLKPQTQNEHPHNLLETENTTLEDNCDTQTSSKPKKKKCLKNFICQTCNKGFTSSSDLRRHSATHERAKAFHCQTPNCRWSFDTEGELSVHMTVNHNAEGKAECHLCQKVFKHKKNLRQHLITHKEIKRFNCKYCSKGFNHSHHLQNHEKMHTKETPYLCNECGKGFAVKYNLKIHMRQHSNERPHKCTYCDKSFAQRSTLMTHKHTHTGERPYMCSHCGKTFTTKGNLFIHSEKVHNADQDAGIDTYRHMCRVCQESFKNSASLAEHMKIHTRQYLCDICKQSFALSSALENHIKTHSAGDRSHVCTCCGAGFNRSEHLRSHVLRKHSDIKPYKCEMCQKSFAQSGDLNSHRRTHTGERPYVCQICNHGFAQSNALKVHMRTHTGERPYICTICNKGQCSSGALVQHMRTHNKIKRNNDVINTL